MEPKRSNHFLAHLPTILLLVLFAMSPWLGILFFILRAIDRDAEKKEQTNADPARDSHAEDARTAQSAASGQRSETVSDQDVPTAEQKSAKQWHKTLPPCAPSSVPSSCWWASATWPMPWRSSAGTMRSTGVSC